MGKGSTPELRREPEESIGKLIHYTKSSIDNLLHILTWAITASMLYDITSSCGYVLWRVRLPKVITWSMQRAQQPVLRPLALRDTQTSWVGSSFVAVRTSWSRNHTKDKVYLLLLHQHQEYLMKWPIEQISRRNLSAVAHIGNNITLFSIWILCCLVWVLETSLRDSA